MAMLRTPSFSPKDRGEGFVIVVFSSSQLFPFPQKTFANLNSARGIVSNVGVQGKTRS